MRTLRFREVMAPGEMPFLGPLSLSLFSSWSEDLSSLTLSSRAISHGETMLRTELSEPVPWVSQARALLPGDQRGESGIRVQESSRGLE